MPRLNAELAEVAENSLGKSCSAVLRSLRSRDFFTGSSAGLGRPPTQLVGTGADEWQGCRVAEHSIRLEELTGVFVPRRRMKTLRPGSAHDEAQRRVIATVHGKMILRYSQGGP
jgi:hypothetical protein